VCGDIWLYLHMMSCLLGYLSVVGCRLFAYGKPDTIAIPKPNYILPHKNPDWFYYSGTSLPRFSWVKKCMEHQVEGPRPRGPLVLDPQLDAPYISSPRKT